MSKANVQQVVQIGMVVKNAKEKLENFQKLFNIDESTIQHLETEKLGYKTKYLDKDVSYQLDIYLFKMGGIEFELIQPLSPSGDAYSDFLKEHGEGIHHIFVAVEDTKGFVNLMEQRGTKQHTSGSLNFGPPIGEAPYIYYDLRDELGLLLEMSVYEGPGAG